MPNTLQGMNWCRKDFRLACYLRGGAACVWCAQGIEDGITLTLDHVVPREQGGNNSAYNVVCACHRCKTVRGSRSAEEFATAAALFLNHGVSAEAILSCIREQAARPLAPFREEARRILARRPSWQAALAEIGSPAYT